MNYSALWLLAGGILAAAILLAIALLVWLSSKSRLQPLPTTKLAVLGQGQFTEGVIPPIVWTYWHDATPPLMVQRCIEGWQRLNPQHTIHVLHPGNLTEFLPSVPASLGRLNIAKQTDWIRLALLQRYGGVWIDASIILTQPLDWVEHQRKAQQAEFVGFYLDGYSSNPHFPVVESWFLAAVPDSPFIARWLARFQAVAVDGETSDYLQELKSKEQYTALTQKIGDPSYHTIHVVAQDVLQNQIAEHSAMRLCLLRAEDTAYWLHWQSAWKRRPLFAKLLWAKGDAHVWPALVKLRGGERTKLNTWLLTRRYRQDSLVGRYLAAPPQQ